MWVLILITVINSGTAATSTDMSSKETCRNAAKVLVQQASQENVFSSPPYKPTIHAYCVPK